MWICTKLGREFSRPNVRGKRRGWGWVGVLGAERTRPYMEMGGSSRRRGFSRGHGRGGGEDLGRAFTGGRGRERVEILSNVRVRTRP